MNPRRLLLSCLCVFIALLAQAQVRAIHSPLSRPDMELALALTRWPHSEADRARFHDRYIVPVDGPMVDGFSVTQVEVTTEFRRLELIGEHHARINDLFGRGGLRDAEEALRPWRDRLSISAHLAFDLAKYKYITGIPSIDVVFGGPVAVAPLDVRRTGIYGNDSGLIRGIVEVVFDAVSIGQTSRPVIVLWHGTELARVSIDFAQLD